MATARLTSTRVTTVDREVGGAAPDARPGGGGSRSGGTVRSVGLSVPSPLLAVSGSPITQAGTLALTLPARPANTVFAGPGTGADAAPAFRALVAADLPMDYEEGTFTPAFTFDTPGDLSVAYTIQDGRFVRLGDYVWFLVALSFTPTYTTASGVGRITGLPYNHFNGDPLARTPVHMVQAATWPAGTTQIIASLVVNASTIAVQSVGTGVAQQTWGTTQFPSAAARTLRTQGLYLRA